MWNKQADLEHLITTTKADQIMLTETKLDNNKFDQIKNLIAS